MSTVKNADLWTVTFLDANNQPATPDGPVSWWVTRNRRYLDMDGQEITPEYFANGKLDLDSVVATTQELDEEVSTGRFDLAYTPLLGGLYEVKGFAVVGGEDQAVPATQVEVER